MFRKILENFRSHDSVVRSNIFNENPRDSTIGVVNGGAGGAGPPRFETWGGQVSQAPSVFHLRLSFIDCFCFFCFFAKFEFSIFDMFSQVSFKLFTFLKMLLVVFQSPNIIIQIRRTNKHTYTHNNRVLINYVIHLCF